MSSQKVVCKSAEATGEFIGKKIADKTVKPKPVIDGNFTNVEKTVVPPEKREEILNKL